MIDNEIAHKKSGNPAYIKFKMNSLVDEQMIDKLYEASRAGVKVDLIIRGICCLNPDFSSVKNPINIVSIVDKFLEHARIYIFGNGGNEKIYMGSADLMTRNIDNRVEVTFPVLDSNIKNDLRSLFDIQQSDNTKARIIDTYQINDYKSTKVPAIRSQEEFYNYLKIKHSV
jgi:polyphosphate kinase